MRLTMPLQTRKEVNKARMKYELGINICHCCLKPTRHYVHLRGGRTVCTAHLATKE